MNGYRVGPLQITVAKLDTGEKRQRAAAHQISRHFWSAVALHRFSAVPRTTHLQLLHNMEPRAALGTGFFLAFRLNCWLNEAVQHPVFQSLDHLAIAVPDTEEALKHWRDRVGLKVLFSEVVNQGTVRLTHLDLGNTHLQLVEPLTPDHPIREWLRNNGPGLHHLCFRVDNAQRAFDQLPGMNLRTAPSMHQGTQGKRAFFLDTDATQGVRVEMTGP